MGLLDRIRKKKKEELPLIARVNLIELQKQREESMVLGDKSILAKADYTKRIPTIRLYYVAFNKFKRYGTGYTYIGQTYGISSPFRLPHGMTIEDACKVVSYLSEKLEKENDLEPSSEKSVAMVSNELTKYGFERVESKEHGHYHAVSEYIPFHNITAKPFSICEKIDGVVDLFTVNGDVKLFKKTDLHDRYFDWFTAGISKDEVIDIYNQIGMNLDEMLKPVQYNWIPKEEYDDCYRLDVNNQYPQSEEDTLSR